MFMRLVLETLTCAAILFRSDNARIDDYCHYHYYQTYARIPPYIIGILLGWILHNVKDRKININRVKVTSCIINPTKFREKGISRNSFLITFNFSLSC